MYFAFWCGYDEKLKNFLKKKKFLPKHSTSFLFMLRKKENERKQQVPTNFFQYFEKKFLSNPVKRTFSGLLDGHILPSLEGGTSFCFLFVFFFLDCRLETGSLIKLLTVVAKCHQNRKSCLKL